MSKRVLAFGAVLGVLAAALLAVLAIVDVITLDEFQESLIKIVLVLGVSTLAVVVSLAIGRLGKKE